MMKKDILYTVKGPSKGSKGNLFFGGGFANYSYGSTQFNPNPGGNAQTTGLGKDSGSSLTGSSTSIPKTNFYVDVDKLRSGNASNFGNTLQQVGAGVLAAAPDEVMDYADPLWHVAGGRHSSFGDSMGNLGKNTFKAGLSSGNPYVMLAGAGLKVGGDLVNLGWGYNIGNEKNVKDNINRLAGVKFKAGDHDTLASQYGKTNLGTVSLGKVSNGLFNHKGSKIADDLAYTQNTLADFAYRDWRNQGLNIDKNTLGNDMRNSYAFGGDMSAIDYGLAQDFLTIQKEKARNKNKMDGMNSLAFANGFGGGGCLCRPYCKGGTLFALGGDVQMNGADYSTGLTHVDAGSSHELNPNEGVQMGVDPEGVPNLVEEGEAIFNDYVYSNRIQLDEEAKERLHFGKKQDITYAEAAKKLEREIQERPNDPISKAGFKVQMEQLAEEQEKQKAEMEATRAREAFEALSPEEQVAVMDNLTEMRDAQAAQEEAMAQETAQQQMSPEEAAMMQQQAMEGQAAALQQSTQPMAGMGAEAVAPQEAPDMMAEGGNLFAKGSQMRNTGSWKKGTQAENWSAYTRAGLEDYLKGIIERINNAKDATAKEAIRKEAIETVNGIQKAYANAYQANLSPSEMKEAVEGLQQAFQKAGGNKYFSKIAENINLPKGANTKDREESGWVDGYWGPRTSIRNWGTTEYGDIDYSGIADLARQAGMTYAPMVDMTYGDKYQLYGLGMLPATTVTPGVRTVGYSKIGQTSPIEQKMVMDENGLANVITTPVPTEEVLRAREDAERKAQTGKAAGTGADDLEPVPVYRDERLRYAGLLGPAVGLGMQMAGIGKPDTRSLQQVAEDFARNTPELATYKPIGNYMRYRPIDIWAEQAALNAQSRATDRAISNTSNPAKMAGLVANGLNSQIASGDALRKDTAANLAQNMQVENFNKGTDMFNAEAFNRTSATNAEMRNRYNQYLSQLRMGSAQAKMAADSDWYQGIYGNVGSLFKGISDLGRENAQHNMIAEMAANGIFGPMSPSTWIGKHGRYLTWRPKQNSACKGGKISKRKG